MAQVMQEAPVWHLEVREGNAAARNLYQKLGFVEVGRRRAYYSDQETAVLLSWGL
jgi:ribosomal-protein-alanine N-acetyltransferase